MECVCEVSVGISRLLLDCRDTSTPKAETSVTLTLFGKPQSLVQDFNVFNSQPSYFKFSILILNLKNVEELKDMMAKERFTVVVEQRGYKFALTTNAWRLMVSMKCHKISKLGLRGMIIFKLKAVTPHKGSGAHISGPISFTFNKREPLSKPPKDVPESMYTLLITFQHLLGLVQTKEDGQHASDESSINPLHESASSWSNAVEASNIILAAVKYFEHSDDVLNSDQRRFLNDYVRSQRFDFHEYLRKLFKTFGSRILPPLFAEYIAYSDFYKNTRSSDESSVKLASASPSPTTVDTGKDGSMCELEPQVTYRTAQGTPGRNTTHSQGSDFRNYNSCRNLGNNSEKFERKSSSKSNVKNVCKQHSNQSSSIRSKWTRRKGLVKVPVVRLNGRGNQAKYHVNCVDADTFEYVPRLKLNMSREIDR